MTSALPKMAIPLTKTIWLPIILSLYRLNFVRGAAGCRRKPLVYGA